MNAKTTNSPQEEFLTDAMHRLNLTPEQFAQRLSVTAEQIRRYLLPINDPQFVDLPAQCWSLIREWKA